MAKIINACCISATFALCAVSCSTMLSNKGATEYVTEEAQTALDSLELAALMEREVEDRELLISVDSLDVIASIEAAEEEVEEIDEIDEMINQIFFDETQSKSVALSEYKNITFEDIELDLREENSHYPADGYVTSPYGWRRSRMHAGTDIKVQVGDDIYAAFDGVVRLAKYYGAYGNCLVIRHYNGLETVYGHASKLLVKVNDVVKAGDVVALGGSTGRSTGSHLHFEVRVNGNHINPSFVIDTDKREMRDTTLYISMRNGKIFASNNEDKQAREAKILQEISIRYYTVRSGDTLGAIARRNGTTVTTLCKLNRISSTSVLRIGQRLIVRDGIKVPTTSSSSSSSATTSSSSTKATKAAASSTVDSGNTVTYVVRKGDTLGGIATKHGTTITKICQLNGISRNSTLQIGQRLRVSGTAVSTSSSSSSSSSATHHTVRKGDTLGKIASRNGTTVSEICRLNGITSTTTLQIGQRLVLRGSSTASSGSTSSNASYHTVKSGDTLSKIAKTYGTTVSSLCSLNGISERTTLQIDQRLRVR